jgi:predicted AlkP superfamily phosphohydrolase/phosphomutase
MKTEKNRVIVIGLDSCDPDLFLRWSREGRLPFMNSLITQGTWARLISTRGLFSDSPWPSFNTGVPPSKHGFYNYLQIKRGTTEIIRVDARFPHYLPFWSVLRSRGKKVAVFDVPKTYPLPGIDGIQIASWGEHYPLLKRCSLPPAVARELVARFGKYPHPREAVNPRKVSVELKIYDTIMSNVERKMKAIEFLREQEDWDFFISVFGESHYGGHQLFHHAEKSHWAHNAEWEARLGEALPNIYSSLDSALSTLLGGLTDKATVFILSVHGIETNYSGNLVMPLVMEKLGFQVRPESPRGGDGFSQLLGWTQVFRELIPKSAREFVNHEILPESFHDKVFSRAFSNSIDWKRSRAFFLPSDHFQGFLSINLKGREPWGTVRPGAEYEAVCHEIRDELGRLMNPETGRPAIRQIVQVSRVYQGESLNHLPDLVIQWADEGPIRELHHPRFGLVSIDLNEVRRSQHSAEGFMIAAGRYIQAGAKLNGATTMDLAPTVLHLLGEAVPREMDGKVLLDLLDEKFKKENEIQYGSYPLIVPQEMRL